ACKIFEALDIFDISNLTRLNFGRLIEGKGWRGPSIHNLLLYIWLDILIDDYGLCISGSRLQAHTRTPDIKKTQLILN
ncbi:unnamed protein product, partial [Dovyalis caffra]